MAHSLAPYSIGTANCGTSPLSMTLTRSVKADRRRDPASAEPWATSERRWPGQSPSGPLEAPAWKDKIPFRTSSSKATAGTTDPSGGSGRLKFSGAEGCFSFKALSVSLSWGAKPSAKASSVTNQPCYLLNIFRFSTNNSKTNSKFEKRFPLDCRACQDESIGKQGVTEIQVKNWTMYGKSKNMTF